MEDISKKIAVKKSAKTFDDLLKESYAKSGGFDQEESKSDPVRGLPSKTYCRGLVELFPSVYKWKAKFVKPEIELQELTDRFASTEGVDKAALQLEVVTCALAAENYRLAFNYLNKSVPSLSGDGGVIGNGDKSKGKFAEVKRPFARIRDAFALQSRAQDNFQGAENLHKGHPELVMLNAHVQLSLGTERLYPC